MPYGVLPNQQMSRYEQAGYLPPFAPQYKRKIALTRKISAGGGIVAECPWCVKLGTGTSA
jgi:hypothetical protein